jgi:enamine deaminase RidA (YjgF/YER057c/UK114 family)
MTHRALEPEGWPSPKGYANGVVTSGTVIVLAGQIGWNPVTASFESDDFVPQVRQALVNIAALLHEAGAEPSHLVRLTWFITDRDAYLGARREIGVAYREVMGRNYPPMSVVVVSALIEARALVEIEATAVLPP